MSKAARIRLGAAVTVAFLCGLIFASGFNLTRLSWAQASRPQFATAALTPPASVKTADAFSDAFEWVSDNVTPAVVSIQAETKATRNPHARVPQNLPPGMDDFFHQFQMPQGNQPQESSGTGFIVSKDGYILTNNHVVADGGREADKLTVTLLDHRTFKARVVGRDSTTDVALIKIDANNLPTVSLGHDSSAHVGQWVLAIGNPLGLEFTVTAGIVSAKGRQLGNLLSARWNIQDYIQTDAAINPGNSGGPLVNLQGQVIGINSALASSTGYYAGYGFAIPISLARKVMDDLIKYGRVNRGVLGVSISPVDESEAHIAGMNLNDMHGAAVTGFVDDASGVSPGEKAGLRLNDIVTAIEGSPVDGVADLQRTIRNFEPGQTVKITVVRHGQSVVVPVKLGAASAATTTVANRATSEDNRSGAAAAEKTLGIGVGPIPRQLLQQDTIPNEYLHGLFVNDVSTSGPSFPAPGSNSVTNGLFPSDIIVGTIYPKKTTITSIDDLNKAVSGLKSGDYIQLLVYNWQAAQTHPVNIQIP